MPFDTDTIDYDISILERAELENKAFDMFNISEITSEIIPVEEESTNVRSKVMKIIYSISTDGLKRAITDKEETSEKEILQPSSLKFLEEILEKHTILRLPKSLSIDFILDIIDQHDLQDQDLATLLLLYSNNATILKD